jgi:hypothetical protein
MMESKESPNNIEQGRAAFRSRREMLRLSACAAMASGFTSLLSTVEKASAMIYIPKQERMWDSWMLYHKDTFYLFHLSVEINNPETGWNGYSLATSTDGIHWKEQGCAYRDRRGIGSGYVYKSPTFDRDGKFLMQITRAGNRTFSFAESDDLFHWKELGEKYDFSRDLRWYSPQGRWDMMHVITRPGGGCFGYWTADPVGAVGFGFGESDDGVRWRALPPPVIDWDGEDVVSSGQAEVTSVDQIGDKYYALLHTASGYNGDGSGAYVLVADNPAGPFRADRKAYRLFSTNAIPWKHSGMWCCTCCHTPNGVLVNNHHVTRGVEKGPVKTPWWLAPGASIYLAPLKRAVVDRDNHLRLGYWEGNDKLKALPVTLPTDLNQSTGNAKWRSLPNGVEAAGARAVTEIRPDENTSDVPRFSILMWPSKFVLNQGVVIEGTMTIPPRLNSWKGAAGIFIEEDDGSQGTAILNQTVRSAGGDVVLLGIGLVKKQDMKTWAPDDRVDTGISAGRAKFRLLLRGSLLEFYVNDLLARAYSLPERNYSGRLGLIVAEADARFEDLRAWSMELP